MRLSRRFLFLIVSFALELVLFSVAICAQVQLIRAVLQQASPVMFPCNSLRRTARRCFEKAKSSRLPPSIRRPRTKGIT